MMNIRVLDNAGRLDSQRGTALVMALFVITVLTVVGTMVLNTSIVEIKMAHNQKISSQVFFAAEAGLERGLLMLIRDFEMDSGVNAPWANSNYVGWSESVTETTMTGSTAFDATIRSMDMYTDGNTTNLKRLTLSAGNTVNNCTFQLYKYIVNKDQVYLMSYATGNGGMAAVEYRLLLENVSPYNNAIFSGAGITGQFQGAVNVAGSIYSIGDLDLGSNVHISNNYDDPVNGNAWTTNTILSNILDYESDLDAKIRVNGGELTVGSASTQIGWSGTDGAIYGIYADGGFNDGGYATTHYYEEYQTEVPDVPMPTILDGLYEEFGHDVIDSCIADEGYSTVNESAAATSLYADWATGSGCFTNDTQGVVINSDIVIDKNTASFSYIDSLGNGLIYTAPPLQPSGSYAGTGNLTVVGTVVIKGDLSIGDNKVTGVNYEAVGPIDTSGNWDATEGATLYVDGETTFDVPFYPNMGYLMGSNQGAGFGTNYTNDINSLGVVSTGNINISGQQNQDSTVGFFFTESQANISSQGKFAGTIIAGLVNWSNVPDVFQVPNLRNYLPPGVPGGYDVFRLTQRQWRRVY